MREKPKTVGAHIRDALKAAGIYAVIVSLFAIPISGGILVFIVSYDYADSIWKALGMSLAIGYASCGGILLYTLYFLAEKMEWEYFKRWGTRSWIPFK